MAATDSIRSSLNITILDHENIPDRLHPFIDTELEQEIILEEKGLEIYGPHHPPTKGGTIDIFKVTWDGPNDLDNPQNWSKLYKWFITVICCLLTINVYASSPILNNLDD